MTKELADALTWRWHDGVLDLETIQYDKDARLVRFTILEIEKEPEAGQRMWLLWQRRIYACRVSVRGVLTVRTTGLDKHPELYVERIVAAPDRLEVHGANGSMEIEGTHMRIGWDREVTEMVEKELSFLWFTVAWRAKAGRRMAADLSAHL